MRRIDINLQVSRTFVALAALVFTGSVVLIFTLPLSLLAKLLICMPTLSYGLGILWRHGLAKGKKSINSFYLDKDGWHCLTEGQYRLVELSGHSTVTSLVSVICFNDSLTKKRYSIVVFPDALPRNLYRQLSVEMRTYKAFKPSKTSLSL
jgi:hypothetical protein